MYTLILNVQFSKDVNAPFTSQISMSKYIIYYNYYYDYCALGYARPMFEIDWLNKSTNDV